MAKKNYHCPVCGKEAVIKSSQPVPSCCGRPMEQLPLPVCTKAPIAETARPDDLDEPCDDGTGPKQKK